MFAGAARHRRAALWFELEARAGVHDAARDHGLAALAWLRAAGTACVSCALVEAIEAFTGAMKEDGLGGVLLPPFERARAETKLAALRAVAGDARQALKLLETACTRTDQPKPPKPPRPSPCRSTQSGPGSRTGTGTTPALERVSWPCCPTCRPRTAGRKERVGDGGLAVA